MDAATLDAIEHPTRPVLEELQATARQRIEDRMAEHHMTEVPESVGRRLTYAHYHDWEQEEPEYLFLLADPGVPGEHVVFEASRYAEIPPDAYREKVAVDQLFGARWFAKGDYTRFTSEFLDLCERYGLIELDEPWWQYLLSGEFFHEFYITDVVKYRVSSPSRAGVTACVEEHLLPELIDADPDVMFTFGRRAWNAVRTHLDPAPISDVTPTKNIGDVHGTAHRAREQVDSQIVAAGHMSPNYRGPQITHDEYMRRLEQAVTEIA